MARKSPSRLDKRREVEAAEALGKTATKTTKATKATKTTRKKATTKKKTTRARTKRSKDALPRRNLIWVVFSSTMKEEGRFAYHDRAAAEEKLELLRSKSKKMYFIQPMKVPLTETPLEDASIPVVDPDDVVTPDDADVDADTEVDDTDDDAEDSDDDAEAGEDDDTDTSDDD